MLADRSRLAAVAAATAAVTRQDSGLQRLTAVAARLVGTRFAFVSLVGEHVELLTAASGWGATGLPPTLPAGSSICQHLVAAAGRPLLVSDLQADARYRDLVEVRALDMRSYAGFPVLALDGAVVGGLCVADDVPREWTSDDALLLTDLGVAVSHEIGALVAVQALARARDEERRRAEEQAALHRVAAAVVRGELPQRVLQQAADEVVRLLGADAALVLRFRPDGGTSVVVTAGPSTATSRAWSWFGSLLRERPGGILNGLPDQEDQPCAAVPIRVAGSVWGSLVLLLGPDGLQGRVEQLDQLADFLALVLVNAEAQLELTRLARTDPLTGAANRRVFEEQLTAELDRCDRAGGRLVVALLDLDRFKQVNDVHGHDLGDAVLRAFSDRLGDRLGDADLLARLGGDEWGLLLPDPVDPGAVLEQLRACVEAEPLAGIPATVTVGAALVGAGVRASEVLARADAALYTAKRRGRNGVALA